jgi:outer membrane protein
MKRIKFLVLSFIVIVFPPVLSAVEAPKIAIINVTALFNQSNFVKKANKNLQDNIKNMQDSITKEQKKLQAQIGEYENTKGTEKKNNLALKIKAQQEKIAKRTQESQEKIQQEQNAGMQRFTELLQNAVTKIAKEQHFTTVLNSTAVIYNDSTAWTDITNDVGTLLSKNEAAQR